MERLSPHFWRYEFECPCGCGSNTVDFALLDTLEAARTFFGRPVRVNSGFRCQIHNASIGGAPESQHLQGKAADIRVDDVPPEIVAEYFKNILPTSCGIGLYSDFVHIDVRPTVARWGFE